MKREDRRRSHVLVFMQPIGKPGRDNGGYKRRLRYFNSTGCMSKFIDEPFSQLKSNTRKL